MYDYQGIWSIVLFVVALNSPDPPRDDTDHSGLGSSISNNSKSGFAV